MGSTYNLKDLKKPNFFQQIFKKLPLENAIVEINNILASRNLNDIKIEEIENISAKYNVDLHKRFLTELKGLYLIYLNECFLDNILTDDELKELSSLRHLLSLTDSDVNSLHNELASTIYKKNYDAAISSGQLEQSQKEFIDNLQKNLHLPDDIANKISSESRKHFMDMQLHKIVEDRKISPDEWNEFTAIAKNLNVDIQIDAATKNQLDKFKLYWLIENGNLPPIQIDINLQKNEQCYLSINAEWLEHRTVTQRINYGGVGYRVKIMKGVYYRAGSVKVQRITSEELQVIDSGKVYVTNKRLIFVGHKKNSTIQIGKILSLTPYSDGVGIEKDSGKSPILKVANNSDIFAMTLGRVINDFQIN